MRGLSGDQFSIYIPPHIRLKVPYILRFHKDGRVGMRFWGRRPMIKKMRKYFATHTPKQIRKHWEEVNGPIN